MSLIMYSVDHGRQRAEVVCDTCAYTTDDGIQPIGFASKTIVFSHALTIMAQRGSLPFFWAVNDGLNRRYHGVDGIDGIVAALALIAKAAHADWPSISNELHLVGYSKKRRGFAAVRLMSKHDFEPEELTTGAHFSGVDREFPTSIEPPSVGQWISCAIGLKTQCEASWIGGDLVLHTLTTSGISIQKIYRFADYDDTLQVIEDRWTQAKTSSQRSLSAVTNSLDEVNF